jgi:hypothetical protein
MQASNSMNPTWVQRGVIIMIVGVLLVAAAYVWGNRLSAGTEPSLSQASQFETFRGVAAARAVDASQARDAAAVDSVYAGLRGVAAARAADAASASTAGASYAAKVLQHQGRGVAAVRAVDAAIASAASSSTGSEFASFHGVAAVRAADAA